MAKKIGVPVGANRAYFNRESRENKYSHCKPTTTVDRVCSKICFIYIIDIDQGKNYYNYKELRHINRHCRN